MSFHRTLIQASLRLLVTGSLMVAGHTANATHIARVTTGQTITSQRAHGDARQILCKRPGKGRNRRGNGGRHGRYQGYRGYTDYIPRLGGGYSGLGSGIFRGPMALPNYTPMYHPYLGPIEQPATSSIYEGEVVAADTMTIAIYIKGDGRRTFLLTSHTTFTTIPAGQQPREAYWYDVQPGKRVRLITIGDEAFKVRLLEPAKNS